MNVNKEIVKANRNDFRLHVSLVMRDNVSEADARIIAYSEGKAGLHTRLNPKGDKNETSGRPDTVPANRG